MVDALAEMKTATLAVLRDHKRTFGVGAQSKADMMRRLRALRRDIEIPPIKNLKRREKCKEDLERYLRTYHRRTFRKRFCNDHKLIIQRLQDAIESDTDSAIAADRGKGKSSIVKCTCAWCPLYGHRFFPLWISGSGRDAKRNYRNYKVMFELEPLLLEDFPEVIAPILALGGSSRGAPTQTYHGQRTRIVWGDEYLAFPVVDGLRYIRAFFASLSIEGAIRGQNWEDVRPDIVVMDDIETRESVQSMIETEKRYTKLTEDIPGLAEQGAPFSQVFIGSIMAVDSIADIMTDEKRSPSWNPLRMRFVEQFPDCESVDDGGETPWQTYVRLRRDKENAGPEEANRFLDEHSEEMHEGAIVSWRESFNPRRGERSALQHYYNQLADHGPRFVACEYQNDPESVSEESDRQLRAADIQERTNGVARGTVPLECDILTAFIDVKKRTALHWTVAAFARDGFGGAVVDYGEHRIDPVPGGAEASVRAALETLSETILGREYDCEDGSPMRVSQAFVDSGYGEMTETVYRFCRASAYANIILPSRGVGIRPSDKIYIGGQRRKSRVRQGSRWAIGPTISGRLKVRLCVFDANHWKSFLAARWRAAVGAKDAMTLFGRDGRVHRMFSEHQVAETATRLTVDKTGVSYEEWRERRGGQGKWPNDWWDCMVGCCVAASVSGARTLAAEGGESERQYTVVGGDELRALGGR